MLVIGAEGFGPAAGADEGPADEESASSRAGRDKSNKLKRAEEINAQAAGSAPIRILTEEEFCRLAGVATPAALKQ